MVGHFWNLLTDFLVIKISAAWNVAIHVKRWWNGHKNIGLGGHIHKSFAKVEPFDLEWFHFEWMNLGVVGSIHQKDSTHVHTERLCATPVINLTWVSFSELLVARKDAFTHSGAASTPSSLNNLERWVDSLICFLHHGPEGHLPDVGATPALRD